MTGWDDTAGPTQTTRAATASAEARALCSPPPFIVTHLEFVVLGLPPFVDLQTRERKGTQTRVESDDSWSYVCSRRHTHRAHQQLNPKTPPPHTHMHTHTCIRHAP